MTDDSLIVGVTGRRHIVPTAIERVEASTRLFLRRIVENWRGKGAVWVLSGFAIGADQLVARLVLEEKARDSASPLRLVAVLPMNIAEYSNDFSRDVAKTTANGRTEFDDFRYFETASDFIVELPWTPKNFERVRNGEKVDRTAQYAALGEFLVANSQILLAFWSGDASNVKLGGTADVVLRKLKRISACDEAVYCVSTPEVLRRKNPDGTKTRVPEPIENAGNVAFLSTLPSKEYPTTTSERLDFGPPDVAAIQLTEFLKRI